MKKLDQWYMLWVNDPYVAPEQRGKFVCGLVDGVEVRFPSTGKVSGRVITRESGEQYELGEPEPGYLDFMKRNSIAYDLENPIKLVGKYENMAEEPREPRTPAVISGAFVDCPFCEGKISATMGTTTGDEQLIPPHVAHSKPPCEKFDNLDALEFLTAVNSANVKKHDRS